MKQTFCALLFLLSLGSSIVPPVNAQAVQSVETIYQPFFGKDSTVYYYYEDYTTADWTCLWATQYGGNPGVRWFIDYEGNLDYSTGWFFESYQRSPFYLVDETPYYVYEKTNSKIWAKRDAHSLDSILIYDMNLSVGDSFQIVRGHAKKHVVNSVFWENGVKHILFDLTLLIHSFFDNENDVAYEWIEGSLPLYYVSSLTRIPGLSLVTYIRSVIKDGVLYYQHPLWPEYYDLMVPGAGISKIENTNKVQIRLEEGSITIECTETTSPMPVMLIDTSGHTVYTSFCNSGETRISTVSIEKGIYLLNVGRYTTKIHLQ